MGKAEKQRRNKERKISDLRKRKFQDYQFEEDKNYLVRGFVIPGKVLKNMQEMTSEEN